jgi:hypothetical protein
VLYWVEADQIIGDEYRDGNVPAAMENLPLIRRGFSSLPASIKTYFLRGDSALYDQAARRALGCDDAPARRRIGHGTRGKAHEHPKMAAR